MLSIKDFRQKKIILVFLNEGEKVSFKNDNIVIQSATEIKHQSSCYRLFAVFLIGGITLTSGILERAKRFGFSLIFLKHGLGHYGSWNAKTEGNVLLRRLQYRYDKLSIAKCLMEDKMSQQIEALKKRRDKTERMKNSIASLKKYRSRLSDPEPTLTRQEILGLEGIASRVYFREMFDDMSWSGRKPRARQSIVNLLLDIGYTQLFNFIDALLNLYGFDTYQGVYHQTFYQRKSLVCDLVEPFRPLVDQAIRNAHHLGQIHPEDFTFVQGQYQIFGKKAQPYVRLLLQALLSHKEDIFRYVQAYYRAFIQEKPIEAYPTLTKIRAC